MRWEHDPDDKHCLRLLELGDDGHTYIMGDVTYVPARHQYAAFSNEDCLGMFATLKAAQAAVKAAVKPLEY